MNAKEAIAKLTAWHFSQVGYVEKNSNSSLDSKTANAGDRNYTRYGKIMHDIQPSNMDFPAAWCDAYYDCGMVECFGVDIARKLLHDFDDYTVASADHYKKNGEWHTTNPQEGDQIFFTNSSGICHTGYVYANDGVYVYTVEGNTSGASGVVDNGGGVAKKKYLLSYTRIAGYGRPNYKKVFGEEEIDMEELKKLERTVQEQAKKIAYLEAKVGKPSENYDYIDDNMPRWHRDDVQWAKDREIIVGDENGKLRLSPIKLWTVTVIVRTAKYLGKLMNMKLS